jgi:alpha-D-ribose 1-methylphosphonate 5-triphosphate synthase subunit PhnG
MGILAKAEAAELDEAWQSLDVAPTYAWLRRPEVGLVMVQGRMGGDGAAFNMGEMTVTRCSVRLGCGTVGHAWVAGRDVLKAERAAVLDALLQRPDDFARLAPQIDRLDQLAAARSEMAAKKAAATKVDFFTMVRGEG